MLSDDNIFTQLLTGGPSNHVTIVSDNGEIKINKIVLVSLYTILGNLMRCLKNSDVILLTGMKREEILMLFERLFQQATEFEPSESFMQTIVSILVNNKLDLEVEVGELNKKPEPDELTLDPAIGFITEDHDYVEKEAPIIIKIKRPLQERRNMYKCHICGVDIPLKRGRGGRLEEIRKEHLSSVHGFKLEKCLLCGIMCVEVEKHVERRHNNGAFRTCEICGKCMTIKRMKIHLMKHKRKEDIAKYKNERKACPHCGKLFKSLNDHIRDHCNAIEYERATCKECGKVVKNATHLQRHMKLKHSGVQTEKCICNICGKELSKGSLKEHHRSYHEIRELTVKCEQCDKLFYSDSALKAHIKNFHEEKTTCSVCGIKVRNLNEHMKNIHTKDEDKKFQCQDCGKGFALQGKLKSHRINMHLKTRPFQCRYGCDISYNDSANRNAHEKKTHGKLFTTAKEEKLKEKIKFLGLEEKTFLNPIM